MKANIISTGNSLRGFDLDSIEGYKIGINHAYKYVKVDMTCAFDDPNRWFPDATNTETIKTFGGRWKESGSHINLEPNKVANINYTLIFAINVAIQLGYTDLHIYGCDNYLGDRLHFYDDKPTPPTEVNRYLRSFKKIDGLFEYLAPELEDYKLTFYGSEIKHFENKEL